MAMRRTRRISRISFEEDAAIRSLSLGGQWYWGATYRHHEVRPRGLAPWRKRATGVDVKDGSITAGWREDSLRTRDLWGCRVRGMG